VTQTTNTIYGLDAVFHCKGWKGRDGETLHLLLNMIQPNRLLITWY
jgi:hypothetical protein